MIAHVDLVTPVAHKTLKIVILLGPHLGLGALIIKLVVRVGVKLLQQFYRPVALLAGLGTLQHVFQFLLSQGGGLHHSQWRQRLWCHAVQRFCEQKEASEVKKDSIDRTPQENMVPLLLKKGNYNMFNHFLLEETNTLLQICNAEQCNRATLSCCEGVTSNDLGVPQKYFWEGSPYSKESFLGRGLVAVASYSTLRSLNL